MPVPWLTVGKLVLNNLDSILHVVRPAFTKKKLDEADERTRLLNQQIAELQAAAASNAEQVQELATQLKEVVAALAQSAAEVSAERASRGRMVKIALAASAVALIASVAALWMAWSTSA
jgi:chromosome segregation ATPase